MESLLTEEGAGSLSLDLLSLVAQRFEPPGQCAARRVPRPRCRSRSACQGERASSTSHLAAEMAGKEVRELSAQRKRSAVQREALRDHLTAQAARDAHAILPATFDEAFRLASGWRCVRSGPCPLPLGAECLRAKS